MNDLIARLRSSLWWLAPTLVLCVVIGWEVDWGTAVRRRPPPAEPIVPKPVAVALLPEYAIAGGLAAHAETVNRTLFNPTRRPAPVAVADAAKQRIQRGQFTLTGTTLAGDRSLAFLKEVSGGKARTVKQGETINGMLVAEVKPDRVKFTVGDESEEIVLKVATNPRPTPQPVAQAAAPGAAQPGVAAAGPAGQAGQTPPHPPNPEAIVQQTLAERRRAARAAEAAAAANAAGAQQSGSAPAAAPFPIPQMPQVPQQSTAQPASAQPPADQGSWASVYQRYQQRRQQ